MQYQNLIKYSILTCLIFCLPTFTIAQNESLDFKKQQLNSKYHATKELKDQLIKYDFSLLLTHTDNDQVFGFIGENFQRIRIKFVNVTRDKQSTGIYHIEGRSLVKNELDVFIGTIKITNIRKTKQTHYGVDNQYKNHGIAGQYMILADYEFRENEKSAYAGTFEGVCRMDFYLDKNNRIHYDDIDLNADGYNNNQFVGQWINHKTKVIKRCNWGDFRIPNSGDLDIGAGEFSPNSKYVKYGWQSTVSQKNGKISWWK